MNWYKKAVNTQRLDWDKILGDYDHHINEILAGRKPAGFFPIKYEDMIDYHAYPKIFETIKWIKQNRPDLRVSHFFYKYKNSPTMVEAYALGQPSAVQSILDGTQRMTVQGLKTPESHKMVGEGVGYTQPEIEKFVSDIDTWDVSEEESEGYFKAEDI